MTTVQLNSPSFPSTINLVNRILNECGIESNTTLSAQNFRSNTALQAVNDAVADIHYRNRWTFQKRLTFFNMVVGVNQYVLPADFMRLAIPPILNGNRLKEYTPEEWAAFIPEGSNQIANGMPQAFCVDMNIFRLWPIPDSQTISLYPQLSYIYFMGPGARLGTSDDNATVNLPIDFLEAVVAFGKWKVKMLLEYPDAGAEQQRYESCLRTLMNRDAKGRRQPRLRTYADLDTSYNGWGNG